MIFNDFDNVTKFGELFKSLFVKIKHNPIIFSWQLR